MTSFIGDANVHNLPPAVKAQDATIAAQQLRASFGRLAQEIVQVVETAILNALGLAGLQGQINAGVAGVQSGVAAVEAGLQAALGGLLPAFIDNGDGTLTALGNQVIANGDGTLTVAINAGTTLVNTIVDNADGTLMSMATALNNTIQGFGTHSAAIQGLNTALGNAGLGKPSQLVTALQGVIPAILDNGDGTLTTLGSQVTHNFDGTYTYVAQQVQQGAANLNGLIDNLDGTLMPFFHAVSQGYNNVLGGLLHAFTGNPVTGTTSTQAQQAQVTSAAAALQQRLAGIGNGAEEQVDVEFSAYTNGAIPAIFTGFAINNGTAPTISGGVLTLTASSSTNQEYLYNVATTLTDFQEITGVWTAFSGTTLLIELIGRGANQLNLVTAFWNGSVWTISANINSGGLRTSVFKVTFSDTFSTGASYSLFCGDAASGNAYRFTITKNGVPLPLASVVQGDASQPAGQLYYVDTGQVSTVGGSNRGCGLGFNITNGTASMSSFLFQDTVQSQPSVLVTTTESTASTTYTDLTTTSDLVVVNVGTSGLAQVMISAQLGSNTVGAQSFVSFAASGANTIAAADSASANVPANASATTAEAGTFFLAGLSPGLTTFKMKYRAGSGTANFANRRIGVIAL